MLKWGMVKDIGAVIIPDTHVPYHNVKVLASILDFIDVYKKKIKEIIILGDFADFYAINSHGKHPRLLHMLKEEIDQVNDVLGLFDSISPDIRKVFIEGNHEYRLERYLINQATALFGLTQWDLLFNLNERPNWVSVPYGPKQYYNIMNTDVFARHEPYSNSSAKASLSRSCCNIIYGHVHRVDYYQVRRPDGKVTFNACPGWIGDIKKDLIFDYLKTPPQWELGFGLLSPEGRYTQVEFNDDYSLKFWGKK